jgi:2-oxoglutarate dehydrogenase complex dehydrogenase (E1) component-like enzyme
LSSYNPLLRRFESFLANKYAAAKRFGLEGCETLVPGMKALIDHAAELGMETVCIGMPHRGEITLGRLPPIMSLLGWRNESAA